jgi:hypothetical protein
VHAPPVSTTPAANFVTSTASGVETGGKFATGVNNTSGKFATSVNGTGCKLPSVSTTPAANREESAEKASWDLTFDFRTWKINLFNLY